MNAKQIVNQLIERKLESSSCVLPAGEYYIGDPCYALQNEGKNQDQWDDVLEQTDFFSKPVATLNGKKLCAFSTAYGDGAYSGSDGFEYGVDAGLLGAVPAAIASGRSLQFMKRFVSSGPLRCSCENGVISFRDTGSTRNQVVIDTLGFEEDEEDERNEVDFNDDGED